MYENFLRNYWAVLTKFCILAFRLMEMKIWPPCPFMVKPLKNLLLQNRPGDFDETWYVASGTPAHHLGAIS